MAKSSRPSPSTSPSPARDLPNAPPTWGAPRMIESALLSQTSTDSASSPRPEKKATWSSSEVISPAARRYEPTSRSSNPSPSRSPGEVMERPTSAVGTSPRTMTSALVTAITPPSARSEPRNSATEPRSDGAQPGAPTASSPRPSPSRSPNEVVLKPMWGFGFSGSNGSSIFVNARSWLYEPPARSWLPLKMYAPEMSVAPTTSSSRPSPSMSGSADSDAPKRDCTSVALRMTSASSTCRRVPPPSDEDGTRTRDRCWSRRSTLGRRTRSRPGSPRPDRGVRRRPSPARCARSLPRTSCRARRRRGRDRGRDRRRG